ncbi:hypothetical protein Tco_0356553 [Tanacetum coccineum]
MNEFPSSYANKLSPISLTKANLWKLQANVPKDADYDIWLHLDSIHEVNNKMKNSLYGYFIAAPKWVVNRMDKDKGQTSRADDDVKKMKSSGYNKESPSTKGDLFSLSNSFIALNDENPIIEEVVTGSKDTTPGTQEEGQSSSPLVEMINVFEKHILKGKLVLVDDYEKLMEKVDYLDNLSSDDEVKTASYLVSKPMGVGYGPKSLLEQWREDVVDDDYDLDDDIYEGQKISENIQTLCDNLDIKVRGRKKK